jgi:hypothetical protein
MKNLLSLFICLVMLTTACGNQNKETQSQESEVKEKMESLEDMRSDDFKAAKDCEEFIDQYEQCMDNYIALLERYMNNPADAALAQEHMKVSQEAMNWVSQWNTHLAQCASNEKYEKRFNEISERAEKKLNEMGLE